MKITVTQRNLELIRQVETDQHDNPETVYLLIDRFFPQPATPCTELVKAKVSERSEQLTAEHTKTKATVEGLRKEATASDGGTNYQPGYPLGPHPSRLMRVDYPPYCPDPQYPVLQEISDTDCGLERTFLVWCRKEEP